MPRPCKLTFDLLTLKVVSESRVTWATSANFSLPRPLCSRLRPDVHDRQTSNVRQTDVRRASSLNAPTQGRVHNYGLINNSRNNKGNYIINNDDLFTC